jgi:hypothetical protein
LISRRLELPIPVPKTQSAFHRRAQRTAARRRDVRQQWGSFARKKKCNKLRGAKKLNGDLNLARCYESARCPIPASPHR